jgi:hypothetical protein
MLRAVRQFSFFVLALSLFLPCLAGELNGRAFSGASGCGLDSSPFSGPIVDRQADQQDSALLAFKNKEKETPSQDNGPFKLERVRQDAKIRIVKRNVTVNTSTCGPACLHNIPLFPIPPPCQA